MHIANICTLKWNGDLKTAQELSFVENKEVRPCKTGTFPLRPYQNDYKDYFCD